MAKPMLVTLPFVLLLQLDWWPIGRIDSVASGNVMSCWESFLAPGRD